MKKLIVFMLAICMVFGLCACGGNKDKAPDETTDAPKVSVAGRYVLYASDQFDYHMDEEEIKELGFDKTEYFVLNDDGTGTWGMEGLEFSIVYDGKTLKEDDEHAESYSYEIKDGKLTLHIEESVIYYYKLVKE